MERASAETTRWAFKPGDTFHQYSVLRLLGAGLHGEVYQVEHRLTHDRFALKVMHLEDVRDASRVRRALSTALASYRIQHANVVTVHDIGCEEDGKVWVRMEYLDGGSIGELLARQRGRISIPLAFHIAIEAAWAIDAAHEMQIIHRDVKPENVWLTAAGAVKVIDFSLAKVIPDGVQTTQRKGGFGTAPYMAPEALKGAVPDARVDIYALGMMLWQMLGGRHPWSDVLRNTTEIIRRQLHATPPRLADVAGLPPYVDEFMRRALAKEPADRFMTIAEMAQAMMALRDQLWADAARGLVDMHAPPGEPRVYGDARTTRRYHATHEVSTAVADPGHAGARVVVAGPPPLEVGPGGTLTLAAVRADVIEPCVVAPPLGGASPAERTPTPTPRAAPPAPESAPLRTTPIAQRDTANGVTRGMPPTPGAAPRAWGRGVLVALALVSALIASFSVVAWRRGRAARAPVHAAPTMPLVAAPEPVALAPSGSSLPETDGGAPASAPPSAAPAPAAPVASSTLPAPRAPTRTAATAIARPALSPTPMAPQPSAAPSAKKPTANRLFDAEP